MLAPPTPAADTADTAAAVVGDGPPAVKDESAVPFFNRKPPELEGIDIIEHVDAPLPLDLEFVNDRGQTVALRDYFDGTRPIVLTLVYYRCPMLCSAVLNGMVSGLQELEWSIGQDFRVVTVSFDPEEGTKLAAVKKEAYVGTYNRPGAAEGWHFHTGTEPNIRKLTDAVGFTFEKQSDGQYAHSAVIILCTPDGRISRYVYGILPKAGDLRLALVEAGEGKVGSAFDRFILWCHRYDPHSKGYAKNAFNIMKLGGVLTLVAMAAGFFVLRRLDFYDAVRHRAAFASDTTLIADGPKT
jgi:protein SCO1/2